MPIRSAAAGNELDTRREEVTVRRLLAYAAGIGDTSATVFDDARQEGIVALPAFCVALEWPVVSSPASRRHLGPSDEEIGRGVHASQDSWFRRPIRPGQRLETRGRIAAVRSTSAGGLVSMRLETREEGTEEPAVVSWSTSIYRGVPVEGEDRVVEEAPKLPDLSPGEGADRLELEIDRQLPHVYTECAQIWNPIHTERRVALAAGLPDIILHGTATWALAQREIVRLYADGRPQRLRRFSGQFRGMVVPGTTIVLEHGPRVDGRIPFSVRNEQGELAVAFGCAELE